MTEAWTVEANPTGVGGGGGTIHPRLAIVTALPKELAAVGRLLRQSTTRQIPGDSTLYTVGSIPTANGSHSVVVACMTKYGNNTAAIISTNIHRSFPSVTEIILVGICAGVPRPERPSAHVRLGDVIVSSGPGVVQFDMGAMRAGELEHRGTAPPPSPRLLQAVNLVSASLTIDPGIWPKHLDRVLAAARVQRPSREPVKPFRHPLDRTRMANIPKIVTGAIGASNLLLKDSRLRDAVSAKHGLVGIEMEGSGVADSTWDSAIGYLVVRSVCDYADENKDDSWQEYAANVAAAYLDLVLLALPGNAPAVPDGDLSGLSFHPDPEVSRHLAKEAPTPTREISGKSVVENEVTIGGGVVRVPLTTQRLTGVAWCGADLVACSGFEGKVYWIDASTAGSIAVPVSRTKMRWACALPDVPKMLMSDDDGTVWLLRGPREPAVRLCKAASAVYTIAHLPGTARFVTGERSGQVVEWEMRDRRGQTPRALRTRDVAATRSPVFALHASATAVVSGNAEGEVSFHTGQHAGTTWSAGRDAVFAIDSDDRTGHVVVGDAAGGLHVRLGPQSTSLRLHEDAIRSLKIDFPWVVTYSKDGLAKAVDLRSNGVFLLYEGRDYGYQLATDRTKSRLALVNGGGELVLLRLPKRLSELSTQDLDAWTSAGESDAP